MNRPPKMCVGCGSSFPEPTAKHGASWWAKRRYCSGDCYNRNRPTEAPAVRFWRYVRKSEGCWEWTAALGGSDYGTFGLNRREMVPAHRFSWELHFGPIPPGLLVCHHCDNPKCVRPDHLFMGTPLANTRDMIRKGRRVLRPARGEANGSSKLTEAKVLEIRHRRAAGETARALAQEFGVSSPLISYIAKRKAWRHVA